MTVTLRAARENIATGLRASRDHDAYWSRATCGWRALPDVATVAGRGAYVAADRVAKALAALQAEGLVEPRKDGAWRWVEAVVPVGGDARLAQP